MSRAVMFVDAPRQVDLEVTEGVSGGLVPSIQIAAITYAAQLLSAALLWTRLPLDKAIESFSKDFLARLRAIEVSVPTLEEWSRAVAFAQGR